MPKSMIEAYLLGIPGLDDAFKPLPLDEEDLRQEVILAQLTGEKVKTFTERISVQ